MENFKAIESAIRRAMVARQISIRSEKFLELLVASLKAKIISQETKNTINKIRKLRNKAIHREESITKDQAHMVLNTTHEILRVITRNIELEEEIE